MDKQHYYFKLIPPRPSFPQDITSEERALMDQHSVYFRQHFDLGNLLLYGPVMAPKGAFGVGILEVADEAEARRFGENDPSVPKPAYAVARNLGEYDDFLGGKATLKLVRLGMGPPPAPQIDLMLVMPNEHTGPAPIFLAMDFCGNHALTADARVPLARSWMASSCKGCTNNAATDAARGSQAADWPLAEIVRRGYALAAFYSGDVDPDRKEVSEGVSAWLAGGDPAS